MHELVEAVEAERQGRQWSLREFERHTGIDHSTWCYITQGRQNPSVPTVKKMLAAFPEYGETVIEFLFRVDTRPNRARRGQPQGRP